MGSPTDEILLEKNDRVTGGRKRLITEGRIMMMMMMMMSEWCFFGFWGFVVANGCVSCDWLNSYGTQLGSTPWNPAEGAEKKCFVFLRFWVLKINNRRILYSVDVSIRKPASRKRRVTTFNTHAQVCDVGVKNRVVTSEYITQSERLDINRRTQWLLVRNRY